MEGVADFPRGAVAGDIFGGLTVSQTMKPKGFGSHLRPEDCLGDLADALASTGRTAMGVTSVDHDVLGMGTVNDIMRAYFEGVPAKTRLSDWLRSAGARAPENLFRRLEVKPDSLLSEVAAKMVANAVRGDCACHHVLVKEGDEQLHGVISSHDLVEAFRYQDMWKQLLRDFELESDPAAPPDAEDEMATTLVRDIMKPRDRVFACEPTDTLKEALRTLLVTQQNFLLVASGQGIWGFVTSRDMVKAFADCVSSETTVADFLKTQPPESTPRTISSESQVIEVAEDMTNYEVDHLVVTRPTDSEIVGVVSSLDIILHSRAKGIVLEAPTWSGPTVGEVLQEHTAKTALCTNDTTLSMVCARLLAAGQTSLLVGEGTTARGILTEMDIVRAFVNNFTKDETVGDLSQDFGEHKVPHYLQVTPNTHLTEASAMMLHAIEPGRSCHHLVVRAVTGGWVGVFSALDVARALHHLSSHLDVAKLGVDHLTVGSIMKSVFTVPKCSTSETLKDVLRLFQEHRQTAVTVIDGNSVLGLITPRCALQGLADGTKPSITVGDWMRTRRTPEGPREVPADMAIMEAAALMTELNLHHLLVVEELGGEIAGVLSALDIVRGVVSMHQQRPFLTLSWLRRVGVPTAFAPQGSQTKRPAGDIEGEPVAKAYRAAECGA